MKSLYESKKSIPSGRDENTGSTECTAPRKTMFFSMFKKLLPLLLFFFATAAFSQQLYMDHYVGCVGFGSGGGGGIPPRVIDFTETIDDDPTGSGTDLPCFRVCENTEVHYWFHEPNDIESVVWEAEGGVLIDNWDTPEHKALVKWGESIPGSSSEGTLIVTITLTNSTVVERRICVDIIQGPTALFRLDGLEENKSCTNAPVLFENLSIGGLHYLWDFGDYANPAGNYSSSFEPQYTYTQPGTYTVTLTVTNKCNCEDTYEMQIHIVDALPMLISCPGVVCEHDIVRYSVNDPCPGSWVVEGAQIIGGGDGQTFIEVRWNDVDPVDGFGYIHYRSNCGCPFWTTEKVPVIPQQAEIEGFAIICEGTQNRYTLPQWPTTEYQWELITDTVPPQLVWLDQRNEVIIDALTPGNYTLKCTYYNTLLGCSGEAEIEIEIIEKIEIVGENVFCRNTMTPQEFTTVSGQPVNWKLVSNYNNSVIDQKFNEVTYMYTFGYPETYYTLIASFDGCSSDPFPISVLHVNGTPFDAITGPEIICPGQTYTYSCPNNAPNTALVWSVTGGATIQGSHTGNSVNIKYTGAGPYVVKVERVPTGGTILCEIWTETTLDVEAVDVQVNIAHNYNPPKFCPGSTSVFTADLGQAIADHISWELSPSSFGSLIIDENNIEQISIKWNNALPGQTTAQLRLTAIICGLNYTDLITVEVFEMPSIVVGPIDSICPEAETFEVPVTINGPTSGITDILFDFGTGTPQSKPFVGNGLYEVYNQFTNTLATDITQALTVRINKPNNCNISPFTVADVTVFPQTVITIFPMTSPLIICTEEPYSHTLTSNFSTGDTESVIFQWMKGSTDIPNANSSSYTINNVTQPTDPLGTYSLKVIDANGCVAYSQSVTVVENCEPGGGTEDPPCGIIPDPIGSFTAGWNGCNITASLVASPEPISVSWGSTSGAMITGDKQGADFEVGIPGIHTVTAWIEYSECTLIKHYTVEVNYVPEFNISITCINNGRYNVSLQNNSMVYNLNNSQITYTYSGTGISGSLNGEYQSFSNLGPGTYTYNLTLSAPGKPSCTVTQTITLESVPNPNNFTISPNQQTYCPNQALELTIPNFNAFNAAGYMFEWSTSDGTQTATAATTEMSFVSSNSSHPITLIIQTPRGCTLTSNPKSINVPNVTLGGNLSHSSVNICEGEAFSGITFTPSIGNPNKVIWMNGNTAVGEGSPFYPEESGMYWVMLENASGCRYTNSELIGTTTADVTIRKRPYVNILGSETLCFGESMTLVGEITDPTLRRQWLAGSPPVPMSAPYGTMSVNTPLELEIPDTPPGTYVYTLRVEPVGDQDCGNSTTFELTIYDPAPEPVLSYDVILCEPYTVEVKATGPSVGQYNWSNGESGSVIEVNVGGAYRVFYTDLNGCVSTVEITVPHHTERYLWMFPSGCYDVCPWSNPTPYIIGPWAKFDNHQWYVNDQVAQTGNNGPVEDLAVNQLGTYQLTISQDGCLYESKLAYILPDPNSCQVQSCNLSFNLSSAQPMGVGMYRIQGYIGNPYSTPITVTLSSFNGYGTYNPSSITIPPGGTYNFIPPNPPLVFNGHSGFYGGNDYLMISIPELPCIRMHPIHFPMTGPSSAKMMSEDIAVEQSGASLMVTPNPSDALAIASYNLGDAYEKADHILVHNMNGMLISRIALETDRGDVLLDISTWPSGTYIISLQADGTAILHQKLIKK